jgi:two-component system, NtrC family, response regulator AtoC
MLEAVRLAHVYARVPDPPEPVVIVGETGTGKSSLAQLVHTLSGRPGILVERSCGELDSPLAADELFGHDKHAFTGALTRRHGAFAEAGAGAVLLDEFHLLPRGAQWLLLRVLGARKWRALGSDRELEVQARLIVGVNRDLGALVAEGTLLLDLRSRLGWQIIRLPPLRERREEIAPLALRFLEECIRADETDGPRGFAPAVMAAFEAAPWPANVRDLRGVVRRAYAHARFDGRETIGLDHLPPELGTLPRYDPRSDLTTQLRVVSWALWQCEGQVARAAELIGAHRNTVSKLRTMIRSASGGGSMCTVHTGAPSRVQRATPGNGNRGAAEGSTRSTAGP